MAPRMSVAVDIWTIQSSLGAARGECAAFMADEAEQASARSFADLYREHARFVWRILRRLGVAPSEVDDVAHEVFMVAFQRRDSLYAESYERSWLFGIAKRVALQAHRKAKRRPETLDASHPASPVEGPEAAVARQQAASLAQAAIDKLDERRRMVFVLCELEEMSAPEVSAALEIPVNTVYSRLRTARREFEDSIRRMRSREERTDGGA